MDLPKVLADLRAAGASQAHVKLRADGSVEELNVMLAPAAPVAPAGLVDRNGKPVNLDEGMGVLEIDPLEEAEPDPVHDANHKKAARAAS